MAPPVFNLFHPPKSSTTGQFKLKCERPVSGSYAQNSNFPTHMKLSYLSPIVSSYCSLFHLLFVQMECLTVASEVTVIHTTYVIVATAASWCFNQAWALGCVQSLCSLMWQINTLYYGFVIGGWYFYRGVYGDAALL